MAEEYGANIASKAGEGEASVWHWEGVQKTINDIYQRDLYHQKRVQDEYTKAQASLSTQASGIRAADIPDFNAAYGKFREASMKLQDRKVYNDPDQRALYSKLKDDNYAEAMSLAERSKEAVKTKASYYQNWMQTGGLNASEDFHQKMNMYDGLSVNQIRDMHFDNPMNFFTTKDDTPDDLGKKILGNQKTIEETTPVKDSKGTVFAYDTKKYALGSENPLGIVANNALSYLSKSKSLTMSARNEFGNLQPAEAKTTIDAANQAIQKEHPGAPPLPYDYAGYFSSKWINQARTRVDAGSGERKYDDLYMNKVTSGEADARQLSSQRFQTKERIAGQNFKQQLADQKLSKIAASYAPIDTTPVYNALKSGDRATSEKALNAVAANNPEKPMAGMISREDILDGDKRRALFASLGIDATVHFTKPKVAEGEDAEQARRNAIVKKSLELINNAAGGNYVSEDDIADGKLVGVFVHTGKVNVFDEKQQYVGTKQTRMPVILNPHTSTQENFGANLSNEFARKKKPQLAAQAAALGGLLNDDEDAGSVTIPSKPAKAKGGSARNPYSIGTKM